MNIYPFWLADNQVLIELKSAYKVAASDKTAANAVSRVLAALHRLIDEAGLHTELQHAIHESLTKGSSVVDQLREREIDILSRLDAVQSEKRLYKELCVARHGEIQSILNQCHIENGRLHDQITALQSQVCGFAKQRKEAEERYRNAGLNESQIIKIGVLPSFNDLAGWKSQLEEKLARAEQIASFYRSSPDYDASLLDVTVAAEAA